MQDGKKFAFGVIAGASSSSVKTRTYVTPEWVFEAGAESYTYTSGNYSQIIPVWTDEIFIEKMQNFVVALGERYNGNENIAWIDIRNYGNWGEQHLRNNWWR